MDTRTADYLFKEDSQRFMEDYQEAVNYLLEITHNEVGVGVRPMSFLAASHAEILRQRDTARTQLANVEKVRQAEAANHGEQLAHLYSVQAQLQKELEQTKALLADCVRRAVP